LEIQSTPTTGALGPLKINIDLVTKHHIICEFSYLLKCIGNPQINTHGTYRVTCEYAQNGKRQKTTKTPSQVPTIGHHDTFLLNSVLIM
jgi:hypothetical protein